MTIDEQVREYMDGWRNGASPHCDSRLPDYARGHDAGRSAYLAAEKLERERLTMCPECAGLGEGAFNRDSLLFVACPTCHGTGRRP